MYHPMLIDFGKAILITIGCPFKTAVHDCSLALTYSLRNMLQILCFHLAKVSGKVKVEIDFVEGQRKCLQTDPKLRFTISCLLSLLKTNFFLETFFCPAIIKYHIPI